MQYLVVDGHCDSILDVYAQKRSLAIKSDLGHLDFFRLQNVVDLQFMAVFVETHYKPNNTLFKALELIDLLDDQISQVNFIEKVLSKKDIEVFTKWNVKVLIALEGGDALGGSLSVLRGLFKLGVRSLTLTWNNRNEIGDGCAEEPYGQGLSKFGKSVVKEMNNLGMLIDVSHLAEKSFWDVINNTQETIIASHSCCKSIMNHPRNLSDQQLKALAQNGGLIGINFYPTFLKDNPLTATIDDVVKHIIHGAEIMGPEHVGIGSDFDGIDQVPKGLEDVTKLPLLIYHLEKAGFSFKEIANIMGNNYLRILKKVLPNE
ncbi:MAG: dipeptidase [Peptococcales bacterium]